MARLPELSDLADASEDEVLALWSGLGYYARARNLHKAARLCMERFKGALPDKAESLTALPGIGPSTANAIISLAFDRPAAILDGNVKRLLARHSGTEGWPGDSKIQRTLWVEAEARLSADRPADYSQAVMDLGALVCTRSSPGCQECPVQTDCRAFESDAVNAIPAPRPGKAIPDKTLHMLVVRDEHGRVLLQRRPSSGIWGGLWSLPEGASHQAACEKLGLEDLARENPASSLPEREHRLTHLRLRIRPTLVTLPRLSGLKCLTVKENSKIAWFDRDAWKALGLPKPVRNLLAELKEQP